MPTCFTASQVLHTSHVLSFVFVRISASPFWHHRIAFSSGKIITKYFFFSFLLVRSSAAMGAAFSFWNSPIYYQCHTQLPTSDWRGFSCHVRAFFCYNSRMCLGIAEQMRFESWRLDSNNSFPAHPHPLIVPFRIIYFSFYFLCLNKWAYNLLCDIANVMRM